MKKMPVQGRERRVSAALRIMMVLLTLAFHLAVLFVLVTFLRQRAAYIYTVMEVVALICAIRIYTRNESPNYKLLWILLISAVPVAALFLYVLLGATDTRKTQGLRQLPEPQPHSSQRIRSSDNLQRLRRQSPAWGRLAAYLQHRGFLLFSGTEVTYFPDGEKYFQHLLEHAARAEHFILLEYFIIAEGRLWDRLFAVLRERAAAGVEVKIIFDDFGNITRFSGETLAEVQEAGIAVQVFNPVHRYVNRMYFNYRDHRKIVSIDGEYAYTGGINVADEYANLTERFGHWKDSGVCLHGEGAWGLTRHFLHMWECMGGEMEEDAEYYCPMETVESQGYCQTLTDGPMNNPENPAEDVFLQMISSATRFLYITTPYLAIEDYMLNALCAAADGGVDVRLMFPGIPDKKYAFMVAESYFETLLAHGVRIYEYTPGFLHAKSVMVDREVAAVGSVNMDYRSFQLHYEVESIVYGAPMIEDLLADMDEIMAASRELRLAEWQHRGWFRRTMETVLRLFAIWM